MISLFPYQRQAVDAIHAAHRGGMKRPAISAATGAGKTIMFATAIDESQERALVIAHRKELIDQAAQKIGFVIDPSEIGVVMADRNQPLRPVVVASIQTIANPHRLGQLGQFGMVVIDEAHHAASPTYRKVLAALGVGPQLPTKALGVSATWDRADHKGLDDVFEDIVFEVGIEQLIVSGHLADVRAIAIETTLNVTGVPGNGDGDFNTEALSREIVESDYADTLANAVRDHAFDRTSLVFAPNVRTAELFAAALNQVGVTATWVSGETPKAEREQAIADLTAGRIKAIVNCAVFTEGTDIPKVDAIVMGRPTASRALYQQMAGRGLRNYPGKTNCLIIDLVGVAGRLELQTAASLLGGKPRKDATTSIASFRDLIDDDEAMERLLEGRSGPDVKGELGQEFTQTAREIALIDRTRMAWTQIDISSFSLPAGSEGQIIIDEQRDGTYRVTRYGVNRSREELAVGLDIGYAQGVAESFVRQAGSGALANPNAKWRRVPATPKQIETLVKLRIPHDPVAITKGEASDLISEKLGKHAIRQIKQGDRYARAS